MTWHKLKSASPAIGQILLLPVTTVTPKKGILDRIRCTGQLTLPQFGQAAKTKKARSGSTYTRQRTFYGQHSATA